MFNHQASFVDKVIKKGSKVYEAKIRFYKKRLTFKDSFAVRAFRCCNDNTDKIKNHGKKAAKCRI